MQTSGQFGVPPPEVPPHYNSVNNSINNNNSNTSTRTTSTSGSNQPLGHLLFNFSTSPDQHAPLSSPPAHPPLPTHSQPAPPVLLSKAGAHDDTAHESKPVLRQQQQQQQQQQNARLSHFLQSTASVPEHFPATENANQEQMAQQKQGNIGQGQAQVQVQAGGQAQAIQLHHQLSLGLDQGYSEGGGGAAKGNERRQMGADPISLGDIDQAEEGAGVGSRWPRQETLALLKIRADMDASFRDTSVKRPLWDEVSRKMGEMGYERNAKKCKEKFENVNKYYKRTKEGKVGRQDGKNYRFFTQLEALSTNHSTNNINNSTNNNININHSSISHLSPGTMLITSTIDSISKFKSAASDHPPLLPSSAPAPPLDHSLRTSDPYLFPPSPASTPAPALLPAPPHLMDAIFRPPLFVANPTVQLSSPSSADDDDDDDDKYDDDDDDGDDDDEDDGADDNADNDHNNPQPRSDLPHNSVQTETKKRKRKASTSMMAFFEGLLKKVIDKQEQMQQKFLQALERRESDRMIREEAWRRQEMARLSKEHELRAQERSSAAARDAALIAFLQKATGQTIELPTVVPRSMPIAAQPVQFAPPLHQENTMMQLYEDHDPSDPNSKRWLKPEVLALIDLHSNLQAKFTEAGPKGHLWEEIANGMAKLGYPSRTAKRCKEKWENINKYFKRAKDSNKKRPENAKTCPYFHELDSLYRKGLLGSSTVNQLPYKPSIEHVQPQNDDDSVVHQPSSTSINTGEGVDGMDLDSARNLLAQPPTISRAPPDGAVALDSNASIASNVSGVGGGDASNCIIGDVSMRIANNNNGGLQSKGPSMQRSADALHSAAPGMNALTTSDHNVNSGARSGFTAELGLNSQQQSASMDLYQHKQMNQSEFGKVNAGGEQESQGQSGLKESKPAVLAPLPNSSSFMSSMLQKINSNNSTVVNNITTNQGQ